MLTIKRGQLFRRNHKRIKKWHYDLSALATVIDLLADRHGTGTSTVYDSNTWTCNAYVKSGGAIDLYMNQSVESFKTSISLLADQPGIETEQRRGPLRERCARSCPERIR